MILEWLISVQNVLIWEEKKKKKILCMIPQRNQIGTVFLPQQMILGVIFDYFLVVWQDLLQETKNQKSEKLDHWDWIELLEQQQHHHHSRYHGFVSKWILLQWVCCKWVVVVVAMGSCWNGFCCNGLLFEMDFGAMRFCCKWVVLVAMDFIAKWVVVVVSLQKCMSVFGIWELNEWWVWLLRVCRVCSDGVKEWFRRVVGFWKRPKERKKHPRTDWLTFRQQRVLLLLRQQKKRSGLGICLMVADGKPFFCLYFCRFFFGFVKERR